MSRTSTPVTRALLVDLYELTMAASYHAEGMNGASTFELFIRELPPVRNYLVACGLEEALDRGDLAARIRSLRPGHGGHRA